MSSSTPARSAFSRVFLVEGGARPDRRPSYQSCMSVGGLSRNFGEETRIECPDPDEWGKFVEVGTTSGSVDRPTTTITGRYASDLRSTMLRLAERGYEVDVRVHLGTSNPPSDHNNFTKVIYIEGSKITSFSTGELGTLSSDGNAVVDETVNISGRTFYEIVPLGLASRAGSVVTNEIVDVIVTDSGSGIVDDGCQVIFSLSKAAGGSPSTPADILYSLDGGSTWRARDVDTLTSSEEPSALAHVGNYVVVVSNGTNSLHYALKSDFDSTSDPAFTEVSTGFVSGGEPNDIWSVGTFSFVVGDGGYIYKCEDPSAGVTALDAGVATTDDLKAVHALSEYFAVAVGNNGSIVKTSNGTTWSLVTSPVSVGVHFTGVWLVDEDTWWITANNGNVYYTVNGGDSFTTKSFSGSGSGVCYDIAFANKAVGYLAHATTAPKGRIFRTTNGGYDWVLMPEGSGVFPANDRITALAACSDNVNFVVGVGLADDGSDGFVIVGQSS